MLVKNEFYLIGNNIGHSLSRYIHNKAFEQFNINAEYMNYDISKIDDIKRLLYSEYFIGANITTPYKERIIEFTDNLTDVSRTINSVNTLFFVDNDIFGTTTDGIGFVNSFSRLEEKYTVYGFGPAARSIVYELNKRRIDVDVIVRNKNKYSKFFKIFDKVKFIDINTQDEVVKSIMTSNVIVDATTVSRYKNNIVYTEVLNHRHICVDINYMRDEKSIFLTIANEKGCNIFDGIDMLINQANESFFIWTGHKFNVDNMKKYIKELQYEF